MASKKQLPLLLFCTTAKADNSGHGTNFGVAPGEEGHFFRDFGTGTFNTVCLRNSDVQGMQPGPMLFPILQTPQNTRHRRLAQLMHIETCAVLHRNCCMQSKNRARAVVRSNHALCPQLPGTSNHLNNAHMHQTRNKHKQPEVLVNYSENHWLQSVNNFFIARNDLRMILYSLFSSHLPMYLQWPLRLVPFAETSSVSISLPHSHDTEQLLS